MPRVPLSHALLLGCSCLAASHALADDFTISTPVTVQNGGNVIDGNDMLTITPTGGITVTGTDAISATGIQNVFDIRGGIVTNGVNSFGMFFGSSNTVDISGSVVTNGPISDGVFGVDTNTVSVSGRVDVLGPASHGIHLRDGNRIDVSGSVISIGPFADTILVRDDNRISVDGLLSTTGDFAFAINAFDRNAIVINGAARTTGNDANAIDVVDSNSITINGSVSTTGDDAFAVSAFDRNTIVINGAARTMGDFANAIDAVDSNSITINGSVSTTGDDAFAVSAFDRNTIVINGAAQTMGDFANAIDVVDFNSVTINGDVSTSGVRADGVNLDDDNIVIINGTVMTSGFRSDAIDGDDRNTATNFGTISVSGFEGEGILLDDFSTAINRGTIFTFGENGDAIDLDDFGSAVNTGRIETFGPNADGIDLDDDGTATNTGYIIVHGPANAGGFLPSAFDGDDRNTFTNSGYIVSVQGNSIDFGGPGNTLNLMAPSFIGGRILLGGGTQVNITTGRSHSVLWDFSTGTLTGGVPSVGGPVPFFWNSATRQFATIDPSSLAATPDVLAQLTGGISRILRSQLGKGGYGYPEPNGVTPLAFHETLDNDASAALDGQAADGPHHRAWIDVFGEFGRYGQIGIFNKTNQQHHGVLAGADAMVLPDLTLGLMAGYVGGRQKVDTFWNITSQEVDTRGLVAGLYGRRYVDHVHVDFALTGGWQRHESTRFVNDNLAPLGVAYASADYDSFFVSPEVTVSRDISMGDGVTIVPSATGRYAAQWNGRYTESGSSANATAAGRTVQVLEGRLELAFAQESDYGKISVRGGVLGRSGLGSGNADITLIGSTVSLPGRRRSGHFAGFAGADAEIKLGQSWSATISGNAQFGQDSSNIYSARGGLSKRF